MAKKVLIVSFFFPPSKDVGGRRWAKFSKYFNEHGIEISVISSYFPSDEGSERWESDIKSIKDRILYVESGYPSVLGRYPNTIWNKIMYRFALVYAKYRLKGNYYDVAGYWKKKLIANIEKKINEGFNNIIVTVAPFKNAQYVVELKRKYPDVRFIVDFRDPWINNRTSYGFELLSNRRKKFEKKAERKVINNFDYIVSVAKEMSDYFSKTYSDQKNVLTIPNGFDMDDIDGIKKKTENTDSIRFIYAGAFYPKALYLLEHLNDALIQLKSDNLGLYELLRFDFYGNTSTAAIEVLSTHDKIVTFHGTVSKDKVLNEISNADFGMLFLTDDLNYAFSTKFCEYIAMNKSIAVFSKSGKTSSYIENNQIGYAFNTSNIYNTLLKIADDVDSNKVLFNPNFDKSNFNIKNLAVKYEGILQESI